MNKLKKKTTIPLLIAVVFIWGFIGVRVFEYFTSSDDTKTEVIRQEFFSKKKTNAQKVKFIKFEKINEDPFRLQKRRVVVKKQKVAKINVKPKAKPQLNFSVKGVIINNSSKMVIIEDHSDKSTQFLKEKEKYKSIKIVKIDEKEISYVEHKKKHSKKF